MNKIKLTLLLSFLAPLLLFAEVTVNGDVWHMSGLAPAERPEWDKLFKEAEELSAKKAYSEARKIVDDLIQDIGTNKFKLKNGDDAELTLAVWRLRLFVREPQNTHIASEEIDNTLKRYADVAKGKRYWAYKMIFIISEDFHYNRQEIKKHDEAMANSILYDPDDKYGVLYLVDCYYRRPWNFEPMTNFWKTYDQIGGRKGPDVEMTRIFTTGDRESRINNGLSWLDKNPNVDQDAIGLCLKGIDLNLNGDEKEEERYRSALYKLALSNTNDVKQLPIVSMALQELEKLDAIRKWSRK